MDPLTGLLGKAINIDDLGRKIYFAAQSFSAPVVGSVLITCADESEKECVDAFQKRVTDYLLPRLKFGERSHFRLANLGGRYEWGSIPIADAHFTTPAAEESFKLMIVKINAHVSMERAPHELIFGEMERYQKKSTYCDALHSLLDGGELPVHKDLTESFQSEGLDRLAILRDESCIPPDHRQLFAAACSARLQARRAFVEIQDLPLVCPTLYLVLPCVTINRKGVDQDILCGVYRADRRTSQAGDAYQGIGDDPTGYRVKDELGRISIEDEGISSVRTARDHRQLALERWRQQVSRGPTAAASPTEKSPPPVAIPKKGAHPVTSSEHQQDLSRILEKTRSKNHHEPGHAKPILKSLLRLLAHIDPVTSAVFCFGEGVAAIHNLYRIERLTQDFNADAEARRMLDEIHNTVDSLPPERARDLVDVLTAEYHR